MEQVLGDSFLVVVGAIPDVFGGVKAPTWAAEEATSNARVMRDLVILTNMMLQLCGSVNYAKTCWKMPEPTNR